MDNIYLLMIIALAFLAVADLVVGVSNDAVNFLNSAIGSKAISFRTIMIVASLGIGIGAIFSSGMMEVARKGIFNPSEFMFSEIMIIFMAVMITDILLLDFFNTVGMPTSTTVSIVFELLGAAVAMAFIKVAADTGNYIDVYKYINTSKATEIIVGILLSVVIAFSIGALVQYFSRMLLSFDFRKKAKWVVSLFGGIALTAITYFILIKGLKGATFVSDGLNAFIINNTLLIIVGSLVLWTVVSYLITIILKFDVYKLIIIVGTFALALAFAGNDLVNFIGVPIAAWQSFEAWQASGVPATEFSMNVLAEEVSTPTFLLFGAGMVMVLTLWFSKKARYVTQTEINLSREGESKERFQPNFLSRGIVRAAMLISQFSNTLLPKTLKDRIDSNFEKPVITLSKDKTYEMPAFDMVRAAVNLMVAGVLISIATSFKLPLSTT
ncbi:MAG: phosphate/sulfate permease, partial [Sediminicola sp.]